MPYFGGYSYRQRPQTWAERRRALDMANPYRPEQPAKRNKVPPVRKK